jgi:hypothetical protein
MLDAGFSILDFSLLIFELLQIFIEDWIEIPSPWGKVRMGLLL